MSDKEEEKHEVILPDAVVAVKISTGFYQKLQSVLNAITADRTKDEMNVAYAKIKEQKVDEEWVQQLETMFILLKEFQVQAKKDGFVASMTETEVKAYIKEKFPEAEKQIKQTEADLKTKKDLNVSMDLSSKPRDEDSPKDAPEPTMKVVRGDDDQ